MRRLTTTAVVIASLWAAQGAARGHDIYKGVTHPHNGTPCCGGEGPDADCEPLESEQIKIGADGIRVFSKRWNTWVQIAEPVVVWGVMPTDPLARPGHFCGKPRAGMQYPPDPSPSDPDPIIRTYCVFLLPGGS